MNSRIPALTMLAFTMPITVAQLPTKPAATGGGLSAIASTAPMRIDVKVFPVKKQTSPSSSVDDTIQRISYRVEIRNGEQQRALAGAKATVVAFAEDLKDRAESIVIAREEFDVSLAPLATTSYNTKEAKLYFDDIGYKYGYKYSGYILVLRDVDGKAVNVNASSTSLAKFAADVLKLEVEDVIDRNYKFVRKGFLRK